jgi:hypothetical protein
MKNSAKFHDAVVLLRFLAIVFVNLKKQASIIPLAPCTYILLHGLWNQESATISSSFKGTISRLNFSFSFIHFPTLGPDNYFTVLYRYVL